MIIYDVIDGKLVPKGENADNKTAKKKASAWTRFKNWYGTHKPISKLDIYIIKKFLGTYFFSIALIISIAVVFDFNENIYKRGITVYFRAYLRNENKFDSAEKLSQQLHADYDAVQEYFEKHKDA